MTRSQKNKRLVIILAVALVVAGLIALLFLPVEGTGGQNGEHITVLETDPDTVVSFSYTHDGELVTMRRVGEKWVCEQDPLLPLDSAKIRPMLDALCKIEASRRLTKIEDEYGLDEPTATYILTLADGAERRVTVGGQNPTTLELYGRIDAQGYAYMLLAGSFDPLDRHLSELVYIDSLPTVTTTNARFFEFVYGGKRLRLEYRKGDLGEYDFTGSREWLVSGSFDAPFAADSTAVFAYISDFTLLSFNSIADYDVTDSDLAAYGLAAPAASIAARYLEGESEREVCLYVGTINPDGYTPVMIRGGSVIYYIATADIAAFIDVDPQRLVPRTVCGISNDYINQLVISYEGESMAVTFTEKYKVDTSGNATYYTEYACDGKVMGSELFESFLFSLLGLTHQGLADGAITVPDFSCVIHTKSESFPSIVFSLQKYDDSFYISRLHDEAPLLVNKRYVEEMLAYLKNVRDAL